ncbi:protein phosphatase 2C domain-containing protein [Kitasatospora sp. MAP5-34]|uniref:protein phosphatase 2C domain-containing protein n=1 Tax=Kitasatospora sp. MAP5-34 TaxID=3035102 RepID=UPI0024743C85|nr:protein phosphatase 2C domain-containing protein [Kitasatospora sp. MAP5-34]MDH6579217.1 hypothetical protein [Kitasatospora sp. MAP5-34]
MSKQGAPPQQHRPEDGWWQAVYTGPADTLPDTPGAVADEGSVDDWFDSAAGMIGTQRTGRQAPAPGTVVELTKPVEPADPGEPGEGGEPGEPGDPGDPVEVTVDEWFDSAVGMIGAQRQEEAPDQPAPAPAPTPTVPDEKPAQALTPAPTPAPALSPSPPSSPPLPPRPSTRKPDQPPVPHVGERPPTYGPEPTALPDADPDELTTVVPDTVLEGARYGVATLRAVSVRGDSARYRGEPRRDTLLVTRFGDGPDGLLLAVLGAPSRSQPPSSAAAEAARQLTAAIGRSRPELAADLRDGARDRLRYGLQRLAARAAAPLRAAATASAATATTDENPPSDGPSSDLPSPDAGSLHCLLVPLDPAATHRAAFGVGPGGLYLLRSGHWIDAYAARLLHHPDGEQPVPAVGTAPPRPFRFRLVPATPGDILLLCTPGLADPVADEPAVAHFLSSHWAHPHPPGTVDFLRQVQVRAKGYADDRTAVALWTE